MADETGDSGVDVENENESLFEEPAVVVEFEFPGETKVGFRCFGKSS